MLPNRRPACRRRRSHQASVNGEPELLQSALGAGDGMTLYAGQRLGESERLRQLGVPGVSQAGHAWLALSNPDSATSPGTIFSHVVQTTETTRLAWRSMSVLISCDSTCETVARQCVQRFIAAIEWCWKDFVQSLTRPRALLGLASVRGGIPDEIPLATRQRQGTAQRCPLGRLCFANDGAHVNIGHKSCTNNC